MENNIQSSETTEALQHLVHLMACSSEHAYPALVGLINYVDKINKLPAKIPFETLNSIFSIVMNFADSDDDMINIYSKWVRFLLRFSDDPFKTDLINAVPDRIKYANHKNTRITELLLEHWGNDCSCSYEAYKLILDSKPPSLKLELLKFLNDNSYSPVMSASNEEIKSLDRYTISALDMFFEKSYYDGDMDKALFVLNYFPRGLWSFWNAHLCNTRSNDYIDALIFFLGKEKVNIENKDILMLQLELKILVNDVEGYLGEDDNIDPEIIREISEELSYEVSSLASADDDAVDRFTQKLYEKIVFNKAKLIYKSIPKTISNDDLISLYIDLKKVFEFCEENSIGDSPLILKQINKVLFEELRDVSSGVNLVSRMLNANSKIKISQYLLKLAYLLEPDSLEMETLYESFVKYLGRNKLSLNQCKSYTEVFNKVCFPQFEVLKYMLDALHKNKTTFKPMIDSIVNNISIYREHSMCFAVTAETIFRTKLGVEAVQYFMASLMSKEIPKYISRTFVRILIDYLNDQPYVDLFSDFPKIKANASVLNVFKEVLDDIFEQALENEDMERELETCHQAIEKCRVFLRAFKSKPRQVMTEGEVHGC
jgi:sulfur relay (sulfurtransferase) DsrC/TusE family protein